MSDRGGKTPTQKWFQHLLLPQLSMRQHLSSNQTKKLQTGGLGIFWFDKGDYQTKIFQVLLFKFSCNFPDAHRKTNDKEVTKGTLKDLRTFQGTFNLYSVVEGSKI